MKILKKIKKKLTEYLFVIMIVFIIINLLSGCNTTPSSTELEASIVHAVVIKDSTEHSPYYDAEKILTNKVSDWFTVEGSTVDVITLDGSSDTVNTVEYEKIEAKIPKFKREQNRKKAVGQVITAVDEVSPLTDEIDMIKCLNTAAGQLGAYTDDGEKTLTMIISGISTIGAMDMKSSGVLNINISDIVSRLAISKELPDLTDVTVDIYGLGFVNQKNGQGAFSGIEVDNLKTLYTEILKAAGVSEQNICIHTDAPGSSTETTSTHVSIIPTSGVNNSIVTTNIEEIEVDTNINLDDVVLKFPENVLHYEAGTANFLATDQEVQNTLTPIYEWYQSNTEKCILIFSATASKGTDDELQELSQERSDSVKSILVKMGIPNENIQTFSLGYKHNPFKVIDTNDEGIFIEEEGAKNRVTYITSADNTDAQLFFDALTND